MNDTPERDEFEQHEKPLPPLPPAPGEAPPSPPRSQAAVAPPREMLPAPPKSPGLAAFLSVLFPGLGHLYSWSYERAFMIWATIVLSILLIVMGWWPFSFLIAFTYFFAIFDAYREAQFFNLQEDEELPKPRSTGQGRLMFGVFLAVVAAIVIVDKLDLFDLYWLYDWWPVPVFLLGIYFIFAALKEKGGRRRGEAAYEDREVDRFGENGS
jgi:hypothetical protein